MIPILATILLIQTQVRPAVAFVTRVAGGGKPAMGKRLPEGTVVQLATDKQSCTLVHLNGTRIQLTGACAYRVSATGFAYLSGNRGTVLASVKAPRWRPSVGDQKSDLALTRLGAIVSRGGEGEDLGPKHVSPYGGLYPDQTRIQWSGFIDGDKQGVDVTSGSKSIWSTSLAPDAKFADLPAQCGQPGVTYECNIVVYKDGRYANSVKFFYRYLTAEDRKVVSDAEGDYLSAAMAGDFDAASILVECYRAYGLNARTKALLDMIKKRDDLSDDEKAWIKG